MRMLSHWFIRQLTQKVMSKMQPKVNNATLDYEARTLKELYKYCLICNNAAINALNNLQSNAQYIKNAATTSNKEDPDKLVEVKKFLDRSGLPLTKLDELSVIHVTGTKGKGTTCAFTESILRHHGFKTGFFSSPHLLEVRERIRIDGKPIEKDLFSYYFWKIYNRLDKLKTSPMDMPLYFRFLTVMAFNVFLEEKVDVAIIEVGIGGEYDCTNVLRKVPVAGITSLGIDHVSLLGDTIESIAWHKAGIMKKGTKVYTVPQTQNAMKVLKDRSLERQCTLNVIDTNFPINVKQNSTFPSDILKLNANLALSLCESWMSTCSTNNNNSPKQFSMKTAQTGINNCIWPGRYQIKEINNIRFHLDGAHTSDSIAVCANWFSDVTKSSNKKKALMFNITGPRDSGQLMKQLRLCQFDTVIFVPNVISSADTNPDNLYKFDTTEILKLRCLEHKELWAKMDENENSVKPAEIVEVCPSIMDGIEFLGTKTEYNLLVTGSVHLIGGVLSLLDPHLEGTL